MLITAAILLSMTACASSPANSSLPESSASSAPSSSSSSSDTASLSLTLDKYPKIDGSTANLPLMAKVMSLVCGIPLEQAEELSEVTTTPNAYKNLVDGKKDILLVYEAAQATQEYIDQSGVALEKTPIGLDALVFITNEKNPVLNLSSEQLMDIYSGKITNWKDVGGNDSEIIAYQRSEESGSQALFIKLLMQDVLPMPAPTELKPMGMGELIDMLAGYKDTANALGFSVYYYANYMYSNPGLRFMQVNGITPSDDTIASKEYPYLNEFYVVIRADEPQDSPARLLRDWILTDEGKAAIVDAGYIPAK